MSLQIKHMAPDASLSFFVESFWMLHNPAENDQEVMVLPDGSIDLMLSRSATDPCHITLRGLDTTTDRSVIKAHTLTFAISFKLPAAEYILHQPVADLLNGGKDLPPGFWGFDSTDLEDFPLFCGKAARQIKTMLTATPDNRKQQLFEWMYASNGNITVKELAEKTFWSSRQINRYFNQQFGMSLKAYCNILRFRASFGHISQGKLFPEQDFADQSHFIKMVKKLSGVSPKDLNRNQNDRFVQFSALKRR